MEKFLEHTGLVVPLDRENVDTDAILPKQFLKSIELTGFGPNLFDEWRYLDTGEPGKDNSSRPLNPDFVLNQRRYEGSSILISRRNFGCGSSREHAPWALQQYGFRVLIAPSFADIFFNNCYKIGMLPIVLPEAEVDRLIDMTQKNKGFKLTINLDRQLVKSTDGHISLLFQITSSRKFRLQHGFDDISLTLRFEEKIMTYQCARLAKYPWLSIPNSV